MTLRIARMPQSALLTAFIFACLQAVSQPHVYTAAQAHSHNDYEQTSPFLLAFKEQFGSVEADIHLVNGTLLVGHDARDLRPERTLEHLYLIPLRALHDPQRPIQLLIDIKTAAIPTLDALIELLKKYPDIIQSPTIRVVVSGNRPEPKMYPKFPDFIWFDGRLEQYYTAEELHKIALLSEDFSKLAGGKNTLPLSGTARNRIQNAITKAHELKKPARLWANPDHPEGWEELMRLGVDYINTDHIQELADFLTRRNEAVHSLPYNRVIRSAGKVVRFGSPQLENHALDVARLDEKGLAIIEDRYGIAVIDIIKQTIRSQWRYVDQSEYRNYMSVYSGIKTFKEGGKTWILWTAASRDNGQSALMIGQWNEGIKEVTHLPFAKSAGAKNALPNEPEVVKENDNYYIYLVLNGNNEAVKIDWKTRKIIWRASTGVAPYGIAIANGKAYVSNWAGRKAVDSLKERAGVPWGLAYTDPRTGATAEGTVTVLNTKDGGFITEIEAGLHPNVIRAAKDQKYVYVANGSSDAISVISTTGNQVTETIPVGMLQNKNNYVGSVPNGLALNADNTLLYVSNGLDNAIAVVHLGKNASTHGKGRSHVNGFIPTEAFPSGLQLMQDHLVVANLESEGANVIDANKKARSIHQQLASVSIIPVPDVASLEKYSKEVVELNYINRIEALSLPPRENVQPLPVPERLGEPSVFKHVVYIIKENKTYDQVFGDIREGKGDSSLCIFGEKITPNTHALAKQFGWMDNYYASGKSSAEGHQWTDAGMVSDYVEKNVRAWFRSYPHRQEDALVYNKSGFIWNHALDHGKTVRIYGEACTTVYDDKMKWKDLYASYSSGKSPEWKNTSTIRRILPVISPTFPDCDNMVFSDQQRASVFIEEWKQFEANNNLPNLMILSLPNDHTAGTAPDFPTPNAMVADNDLALGRIIDIISHSKFWDSTVVFITEDDSQSGWDHVSAYRTVGLVVSPYSAGKLVTAQYNQVSMLRTIEHILGIPPMNMLDASARLMTECFQKQKTSSRYNTLPANVPLDQMNKPLLGLRGKARKHAKLSAEEVFNEVDGGEDDTMNRIIWAYAKGRKKYPRHP
jgi:YVTN family beta-propeller protein